MDYEPEQFEESAYSGGSIWRAVRQIFRLPLADVVILNGHGTPALRFYFIMGLLRLRSDTWILRMDTVEQRTLWSRTLKAVAYRIWLARGHRLAATSVTSSEFLAQTAQTPVQRVLMMPYLVPPAVVPGPPIQTRDPLTFIAAKLNHREGADVTLPVAVRAIRQVPGARLVVAGHGPLRSSLEARYASPEVQFVGWVAYEEYLALLRQARVYVHLPRSEPWGASIAEALLSGTRVVSNQSCVAARELVTEESMGTTVESDQAAVAAIVNCLRDQSEFHLDSGLSRGLRGESWVEALREYRGSS